MSPETTNLPPLETALLIIPPPEVQLFAAPLMERYAPDRAALGPAHMTLFYPFFPFSERTQALPILEAICRQSAPLTITLDHYEQFPSVCYLAPSNGQPIIDLFLRIQAAFPHILPFEGKFGTNLVPHLTRAECGEIEHVELPPDPCFTFTIDRIHLYYGYPVRTAWVPYSIFMLEG
jgi:2'-5' RNA ligase